MSESPVNDTFRDRWRCLLTIVTFLAFCSSLLAGEVIRQLEGFEFATSDAAAANGVTDLSSPSNRPTFFVSGNDPDERSEGQYSIGTDALFGASGKFIAGSIIGFRRYVDPDLFPDGMMPLIHTYGDPNEPGSVTADKPLSELQVIGDFYGRGAFAEGPTGTHLWINLIDAEGEVFNFINYSEESLYLEVFTLDVLVGADIARIAPDSLVDVPDGDRLLTEIVAFEVILQDDDDPPTGEGKWYIDDLRIGEFVTANIILADPVGGSSLWRSQQSIIQFTFDFAIVVPDPGQVEIRELLSGGQFGADLSSGFSYLVDNDDDGHPRRLRITDGGLPDLQHGHWYSVRNVGEWQGVGAFDVPYVVQVGDVDQDGRVLNRDVSLLHAASGQPGDGVADRRDVDGNGVIDGQDIKSAHSYVPSLRVTAPDGH